MCDMWAIGVDGILDVRDLPVYFRLAGLFERLIDLREGTAAKEAVVGRERRRVRRLDDLVTAGIYKRDLLLRVSAPEQEDHLVGLLVDFLNDRVGKSLPALVLMGVRRVGTDGENRIEQQD